MNRWPKKKVEEIAVPVGGGTPSRKSPAYWGAGIPWFTVADLSDDLKPQFLTKSREDITRLGLNNSAAKLIPKGAVVFSVRVVVGKIGIAQNEIVTNQDFISLIPKAIINAEYLSYALLHRRNTIRHNQQGATIRGIRKTHLLSMEISVPPLTEQRRIVARIKECLDRVDEIKLLRKASLRESENLESAIFTDFIKELDVPAVPLGEIISHIQYGTSGKANIAGTGVPILRMGNIQNGYLNIDDLKHIELPEKEIQKYLLNEGDVLFNRTNSLEKVGKAAVFKGLEGRWVFASYLIRLVINKNKAIPEYVNGLINSPLGREFILRTARRAIGMVNINAKEIQKFEIPLPSLNDQKSLIQKVETVRSYALEIRKDLKDGFIGMLPVSILQKAFSGEL